MVIVVLAEQCTITRQNIYGTCTLYLMTLNKNIFMHIIVTYRYILSVISAYIVHILR